MIIKTINELRTYVPNHQLRNLDTMLGFFENSEQDFLRERLGGPLLDELDRRYAELEPDTLVSVQLDRANNPLTPWYQLMLHAQRCVVYNAFERSADIRAVAMSDAGLNVVSAEGYDPSDKERIKNYKDRMWREAHNAVDRMLVWLEELAEGMDPLPDESDEETDAQVIVRLWRSSRYYYLSDGLLINTASRMQDFIDIEADRERFIQMLPDMRFIQRNYLRSELGAALFDDLLQKHRDGTADDAEADIILKMQELLALYTQQRSRVFKFSIEERKRIEEECIGLKRDLLAAVDEYKAALEAAQHPEEEETPEPPAQPEQQGCPCCCNGGSVTTADKGEKSPYWGDKGSVFVMPAIF